MGRKGEGSWGTVKRGTRRYVRFRITIDGRTIERVGPSREALSAEVRRLRERARRHLVGADENTTLRAWAERWLEAKALELGPAGARTVRNYEVALTRHALPALGPVKLRDLRAEHRRRFQRALLAKGLKPSSVNKVDGALRACLKAAADEDLPVVVSVLNAVKPVRAAPEPEHRLTADDVRKVLAAADPFWAPLWAAYAFTGARDAEVRALRWEDYDAEAGLLRIRRQLPQVPGDPPRWQPWVKGRKGGRVVPVVGALAEALRAQRARQTEARLATLGWCEHGLVFADEVGRALPHLRVNRQFTAACEAAGIAVWKGLGTHAIRHAANNVLREAGVDAPLRAQILGHTKAVNEAVYVGDSPALARAALEKAAALLHEATS